MMIMSRRLVGGVTTITGANVGCSWTSGEEFESGAEQMGLDVIDLLQECKDGIDEFLDGKFGGLEGAEVGGVEAVRKFRRLYF